MALEFGLLIILNLSFGGFNQRVQLLITITQCFGRLSFKQETKLGKVILRKERYFYESLIMEH